MKQLVSQQRLDLISIQELKIEQVDEFTCKALWVDEELEWFCKPATRIAGGLLLIWRKNLITLEECF